MIMEGARLVRKYKRACFLSLAIVLSDLRFAPCQFSPEDSDEKVGAANVKNGLR